MIYLAPYEPILDLSKESEKIKLAGGPQSSPVIPDLHAPYPGLSIFSCPKMLHQKLDVKDVIVYFMTQHQEQSQTLDCYRFIAIIQVWMSWSSHQEAADWYRKSDFGIPKYCFKPDTLDSKENEAFHVCQKLYVQFNHPLTLNALQMKKIFGFSELMHEPIEISQKKIDKLLKMVGQPVLQTLIDSEKI